MADDPRDPAPLPQGTGIDRCYSTILEPAASLHRKEADKHKSAQDKQQQPQYPEREGDSFHTLLITAPEKQGNVLFPSSPSFAQHSHRISPQDLADGFVAEAPFAGRRLPCHQVLRQARQLRSIQQVVGRIGETVCASIASRARNVA